MTSLYQQSTICRWDIVDETSIILARRWIDSIRWIYSKWWKYYESGGEKKWDEQGKYSVFLHLISLHSSSSSS